MHLVSLTTRLFLFGEGCCIFFFQIVFFFLLRTYRQTVERGHVLSWSPMSHLSWSSRRAPSIIIALPLLYNKKSILSSFVSISVDMEVILRSLPNLHVHISYKHQLVAFLNLIARVQRSLFDIFSFCIILICCELDGSISFGHQQLKINKIYNS